MGTTSNIIIQTLLLQTVITSHTMTERGWQSGSAAGEFELGFIAV